MNTTETKKETEFFPAKLKALRLLYEKDLAEVERKYRALLRDVDEKIAKVQRTDYITPYINTFSESLRSLEKLYTEMYTVHEETKGIDFRIGNYMSCCSPRSFGRGKVNEHFDRLVAECTAAVRTVAKNQSVEDDVRPLKVFCQCLVDLRYIQKNATRLISESGAAEKDRDADLEPLQQTREKLVRQQEEDSRLEKLPCYPKAKALQDEILASYDRQTQSVLGGSQPGTETDFHFLIGFYQTKIEKAELDFAVNVLGVLAEAVKREPIFFHYTSQRSTILIKAPSAFLETNQYNDFIRNLYFSFVSHLPARDLLLCGVECNTMDAVVGGLGEKIRSELGTNYLCHDVVERGSDLGVSNGVLATVRSHASENSKKQKGESIGDIFEYNRMFPDNPQKFLLFCISNYPEGFNSTTVSTMQDVRRLMNGGSKGIITVVCETTDGAYNDSTPMLTAEELHADCIEFTEDGAMTYNGHAATDDIVAPDFKVQKYWEDLKEYFENSASIKLEALLAEASRTPQKSKPIAIPVGKSGGNVFNLNLTECTNNIFGLIIGTAGKGKSAFLHTMLLSAASNYSPEDLQFYLADFKSGSGSPEFAHYRKIPGVKNLYIPHVRYLLLKGKTENALDLLKIIETMAEERQKLLKNYSQIDQYNASPEVVSGQKPKLPNIFFVIDEYNTMLNGAGTEQGNNHEFSMMIADKLGTLISRYRAYGIGIILCGQSVDRRLNAQAMNNIGCRIAFPVSKDSYLEPMFDIHTNRRTVEKLVAKGDALVAFGGYNSAVHYVRMAYSGQTNGSQQLRLAEEIRRKYSEFDYSQVEAGSEDAVPVSGNVAEFRPAEDKLLLNMGISSANAFRIPLVYSTEKAAFNYYAFASREKLCRIEQNTMFAFLQAMAGQKPLDGFAHVTYLAEKREHRDHLEPYFDAVPGLRRQIDVVENKTEMAKKLLELRQLLIRRDKKADDRQQPLLVVLRDLSWLNSKNADWLPELDTPRSAAVPPQASALSALNLQKIQEMAALQGKALSEKQAAMLKSFKGTEASNTAEPQNAKRATLSQIKDALAELYADGNQYGIFMLVSSEIYTYFNEILMPQKAVTENALGQYGIFGSLEESKLHKADQSAPEHCAFVSYSHSKIRLYDYHPDTCRDWWDALQKRWNG